MYLLCFIIYLFYFMFSSCIFHFGYFIYCIMPFELGVTNYLVLLIIYVMTILLLIFILVLLITSVIFIITMFACFITWPICPIQPHWTRSLFTTQFSSSLSKPDQAYKTRIASDPNTQNQIYPLVAQSPTGPLRPLTPCKPPGPNGHWPKTNITRGPISHQT